MQNGDLIFNKIAEALLIDYSSVYYVNAVTNEYHWYSIDPEFHSLNIEQGGQDFFKNMARDAEKVVYEEDKHIFTHDIQKDKLLKDMMNGGMHSIIYRLMIDGKPVWHTLRLIREVGKGDDYFVLGVLNIDKQIRLSQEAEKLEKEKDRYNQIAMSLAGHYEVIYYINIETSNYFEFSATDSFKKHDISKSGSDFFGESRKNIAKVVHPDDVQRVLELHYPERMIKNLEGKTSYAVTYRMKVDNQFIHYRHTEMWSADKKHIILCMENIEAEIIADRVFNDNQKNSIIYGQIADSLALNYDVIYYVNLENNNYEEFTTNNLYGSLQVKEEGLDFFKDVIKNTKISVFPEDVDRVRMVLNKDYLISALDKSKRFSLDYRLLTEDDPAYTRLTAMWSSDRSHFIIGVEDITAEVEKEEEHLLALRNANEAARRDELTGAKNKMAYREIEDAIDKKIADKSINAEFAIILCDLNNLKKINDTLGHRVGDDYIKKSCNMIFDTFSHSPVFRFGGDEFVVVLMERDYADMDKLVAGIKSQVLANNEKGEGPVIAIGVAVYDSSKDNGVNDVFERADGEMYKNKKELKGER